MAATGLAGLGPGEAAAAAQALALPAESFGNDPRVELAWAMKAHQHAQVYFNLISSVEPKFLKLTQVDERIYEEFRRTFRNLRVDVLDPEELKSEAAKEKWRPFCLSFEGLVEDFNFGTLLRLDSRGEYSEENSILATRIQFLAIEIARNREGCNEHVHGRGRDGGEGARGGALK
ncbi:protein PBDC1 [Camarhynchus parvulus]|nr:protein PBDC1 [Camarhynchus parvulus]